MALQAKEVKVDVSTCVSVSQLMVRLSSHEEGNRAMAMAIFKGKSKNEQLKEMSDVITSIYVGPIEEIKELESEYRKIGGQGGKVGYGSDKIVLECLKTILSNSKDENDEKNDEKNDAKRYDLACVNAAAIKYIGDCDRKCDPTKMSEESYQCGIRFGDYRDVKDILLSNFIDWVCDSSDSMVREAMPQYLNDKLTKIEQLLKKYVSELALHDNPLNVVKHLDVEGNRFSVKVGAKRVMESIEANSFFKNLIDKCGASTMCGLFHEWQQYVKRIKKIPFADLLRKLGELEKYGVHYKMIFLETSLKTEQVNEEEACDAIQRCLTSIQQARYEAFNQQLECSNRLNGIILGHLVFAGQNEHMPIKLFIGRLKTIIKRLDGAYDTYFCVSCQKDNKAHFPFCKNCGFTKIKFVQK